MKRNGCFRVDLRNQWRTFLARERVATIPDDLAVVIADLQKLLMPIARYAIKE